MGYEIHYSGTPDEIDTKAIADIRDYLTEQQWGKVIDYANLVAEGSESVQTLNMVFGIFGITGRPFHAFCRRYCLKQYREWMASEPDPVQTDENGFSIKEEV